MQSSGSSRLVSSSTCGSCHVRMLGTQQIIPGLALGRQPLRPVLEPTRLVGLRVLACGHCLENEISWNPFWIVTAAVTVALQMFSIPVGMVILGQSVPSFFVEGEHQNQFDHKEDGEQEPPAERKSLQRWEQLHAQWKTHRSHLMYASEA